MYGYIAAEGPWCNAPVKQVVTAGQAESNSPVAPVLFRLYPNPTTGHFTLALDGFAPAGQVVVEIYNPKGAKINGASFFGGTLGEFSLSGQPAGLYLVRVVSENRSGTARIVKQ